MKLFEHPDFEQAIIRAADHFRPRGLREAIIEKDYYVTEALRIIEQEAGDKVIFKGLTLQGIYGRRMYETWYKMTQLVLTGFPLGKVLTHQVAIDDFQKGFDLMDSGNCGTVVGCGT